MSNYKKIPNPNYCNKLGVYNNGFHCKKCLYKKSCELKQNPIIGFLIIIFVVIIFYGLIFYSCKQ